MTVFITGSLRRIGLTPPARSPTVPGMVAFDDFVCTLVVRQVLMAGMHARALKRTSVMGTCPPDADT